MLTAIILPHQTLIGAGSAQNDYINSYIAARFGQPVVRAPPVQATSMNSIKLDAWGQPLPGQGASDYAKGRGVQSNRGQPSAITLTSTAPRARFGAAVIPATPPVSIALSRGAPQANSRQIVNSSNAGHAKATAPGPEGIVEFSVQASRELL